MHRNPISGDGLPRHSLPLACLLRLLLCLPLLLAGGCATVENLARNALADALAEGGSAYASDDDVDLVGDATPFALKTLESLLAATPDHRGLLLATASGFTQYAYAYVQLPADVLELSDVDAAYAQRDRARRLYLRARGYGLHGLEVAHPGFAARLRAAPVEAVAATGRADVPLLYWTAVAWAAAISLGKDDPELVAGLGEVDAMAVLYHAEYLHLFERARSQFIRETGLSY
ncbi:MAG TPA: TRAP transporter TatT component family protein, partial [Gammaproteobacteria bacterium]